MGAATKLRTLFASGHIAVAPGNLPATITLLHTLLWPPTQVAGSGSNATATWKASERQWR